MKGSAETSGTDQYLQKNEKDWLDFCGISLRIGSTWCRIGQIFCESKWDCSNFLYMKVGLGQISARTCTTGQIWDWINSTTSNPQITQNILDVTHLGVLGEKTGGTSLSFSQIMFLYCICFI